MKMWYQVLYVQTYISEDIKIKYKSLTKIIKFKLIVITELFLMNF